jgi:hypothetical protein
MLVLASVGTASAECAWVLWGMPYPVKEVTFLPVDAFTTRDECMREKDSRSAAIKAALKEGRSPGFGVSACLPDTVDPRGPKGGAR